ncbi:MAG: serine/threonine protein phosphatase [Candidatus Schekmanbacteria bacterium GWA2_38_11]|uniref:Serine/threonine protein phosphatase n=1 Tax=Candidatus Schekmanbacteria bacterium GWA2_38_11 TaxID=1817876 RepID=A0A1F7REW0_9BACT|nr:MAG: serine/threonine protein phosphatase [Candidatus Schekmanbacteria bacterium GWA2_38_11]
MNNGFPQKTTGGIKRRDFLRMAAGTAVATISGVITPLVIKVAHGKGKLEPFTFAYISDAHLYAGNPNHRFVKAIKKAVADVNSLNPQPDFVFFGGDLAQLGQPDELELGKGILSDVKAKIHMMVGEHDWYFDMGRKWREFFGKDVYSFDHKGVHFVVLNSVIVKDYWTAPNMTPMERMKAMAQLDNPKGEAFTVGEEQRKWLKNDLSKISKDTPLIIFSHSPLYKYYRPWNFWTDDAEQVQEILFPFEKVTVIHGHTHQTVTNKIKNITFHGLLSTAWPWPYPPQGIPKLTIQMDRADPFNQFDGCGDGRVDILSSGEVNKTYNFWDRNPMEVTFERVSKETGSETPGPSY